MSDWTSLSVREDTRDRLNELKEEAADEHTPTMSTNEFLQSLMDTWDAVDDGMYAEEQSTTVESDVDTEHIEAQLDEIQERLKDFSVTQNQERVISRIDDHETEIKTWFEREFKR